jgi:hypothetical protein
MAFLSCVNYRTCVAMTLKLVEDSIAQLYRKRSVTGEKVGEGLSHKRLPCQRTMSNPSATVLKKVPFPEAAKPVITRAPAS